MHVHSTKLCIFIFAILVTRSGNYCMSAREYLALDQQINVIEEKVSGDDQETFKPLQLMWIPWSGAEEEFVAAILFSPATQYC